MKGWIFTTQSTPSYETKRLIECFKDEGIECFFVHPNNVDIFIDKDDRKSVLVENEYTNIYDFVIPRVGSLNHILSESGVQTFRTNGCVVYQW